MNKQYLLILLIPVLVIGLFLALRKNENFQESCPYNNLHPDIVAKDYIAEAEADTEEENDNSKFQSNTKEKLDQVLNKLSEVEDLEEDYVKKDNLDKAVRSMAREYCPVESDFDLSQYIKKSEIENSMKCPKVPDLKDYVLKSTIPPAAKCPSCICPKVKVSAGFCKKCPKPEDICPKPKPCTVDQCKNIVSCPRCPAPPKIKIPKIKCPSPKPCPKERPCPKVTRCPPNQCPKCKYYGIKTVESKKSIKQLLEELMRSDDPNKYDLINELRELLGIKPQVIKVPVASPPVMSNPLPTTSSMFYGETSQEIEEEAEVEDESFMEPQVKYNNKCVDNSLVYAAEGILGSNFN